MTQRNNLISICLTLLVLLAGATTAFADSDSDSDSDCELTGSWRTVVNGNTENIALFTFNEDETMTSSISSPNASGGHGAWEENGSRSFTAKSLAFSFSPSDTLTATLRDEIELSSDCQSYNSAFVTELSLFDGTVVATVVGTSAGTRITVD